MEERLKQRLVGAIVLVSLAVVFVPILLDGPDAPEEEYSVTPIPERPEGRFDSTVRIDLPEPETPRLDAELERERDERASDATSGVRPEPSEAGASPSTPLSDAADTPVVAAVPATGDVELPPTERQTGDAHARAEPSPPVRVKVDSAASEPSAEPPERAGERWAVQLGSFQKSGNAIALRKRLIDEGYEAFVKSGSSEQGEVFRVLVGPSADREHAKNSAAKLLMELNLEGFVVPYPGG